jgi:hypothetical protein
MREKKVKELIKEEMRYLRKSVHSLEKEFFCLKNPFKFGMLEKVHFKDIEVYDANKDKRVKKDGDGVVVDVEVVENQRYYGYINRYIVYENGDKNLKHKIEEEKLTKIK